MCSPSRDTATPIHALTANRQCVVLNARALAIRSGAAGKTVMGEFSRRQVFRSLPLLIGGSILLARRAFADALVSKDSVSYQTTPSDGQQCSACKNYIAGAAGADGSCKVVAGPISPGGYCLAFSPA